jgi:hypothetical protein
LRKDEFDDFLRNMPMERSDIYQWVRRLREYCAQIAQMIGATDDI